MNGIYVNGPRKDPSIRDVAVLAGVSHQTVSRALNDATSVRPETAERVREAIEQLDYRPSRAARWLARRKSMTIGVISVQGALLGPYHMSLAVDEEARARGYATATVTVNDSQPATLSSAREHLLDLGVEGVVIIAWSQALLELANDFAKAMPTCVIADKLVPTSLARVSGDNFEGARQATRAMIEGGRRVVGHIAGPLDWSEAQARLQGWKTESGGGGPFSSGDWSPAHGYQAVEYLLAERRDLDAIFAANDQLAVGAMRRLHELGIRVPDDIAIVGYDDIDVAAYLRVPLASVQQPYTQIGAKAVKLLFEVMDGKEPSEAILPARFIWRVSAG